MHLGRIEHGKVRKTVEKEAYIIALDRYPHMQLLVKKGTQAKEEGPAVWGPA